MLEMSADLRRRLDSVLRDIGFAKSVGVEMLDWEPGRERTALMPGERQTNIHGLVHGAALFALGDAAFEVACNSYGRVSVGLDVTVHYAAPVAAGERVVAVAEELTRSRSVASYRVVLTARETTRCVLLATAYRTSRWHLGESAWPAEWRQAF